jgi:hypothetical protein
MYCSLKKAWLTLRGRLKVDVVDFAEASVVEVGAAEAEEVLEAGADEVAAARRRRNGSP